MLEPYGYYSGGEDEQDLSSSSDDEQCGGHSKSRANDHLQINFDIAEPVSRLPHNLFELSQQQREEELKREANQPSLGSSDISLDSSSLASISDIDDGESESERGNDDDAHDCDENEALPSYGDGYNANDDSISGYSGYSGYSVQSGSDDDNGYSVGYSAGGGDYEEAPSCAYASGASVDGAADCKPMRPSQRRRDNSEGSLGDSSDVDWNEEFQKILALRWRSDDGVPLATFRAERALRVRKLAEQFEAAAKTLCQTIVVELALPADEKTVPQINVGGTAGGDKFLKNNVFFKLAVDQAGLYGGEEAASKSASHEIKGLRGYASVAMNYAYGSDDDDDDDDDEATKRLNTPLMAVVDYCGYRIIATSVLPINKTTLIYGSDDAGRTVKADDARLNRIFERAASLLNIKAHVCGFGADADKRTLLAPTDIEGHIGMDGKFYVCDSARVWPPEAPSKNFVAVSLRPALRSASSSVKKLPTSVVDVELPVRGWEDAVARLFGGAFKRQQIGGGLLCYRDAELAAPGDAENTAAGWLLNRYAKQQDDGASPSPPPPSSSSSSSSSSTAQQLSRHFVVESHEHPMKWVRHSTLAYSCDSCQAMNAPGRFRCARGCDVDFCRQCWTKSSARSQIADHAHALRRVAADGEQQEWLCNGCARSSIDLARDAAESGDAAPPARFRCSVTCDFDYCAECFGFCPQSRRRHCFGTALLVPAGFVGKRLSNLLRPELVRANPCPLSSDAFTAFGKHNARVHNAEVREATRSIVQRIVPAFVARLESGELLPVHSRQLVEMMHGAGINVRYLGVVLAQLSSTGASSRQLRALVHLELVTRVCKNTVRERMRGAIASAAASSDARLRAACADELNLVFGCSRERSDDYWRYVLATSAALKFGCYGTTLFGDAGGTVGGGILMVKRGLSLVLLFAAVCSATGVVMREAVERRMSTAAGAAAQLASPSPFGADDILRIDARVKHLQSAGELAKLLEHRVAGVRALRSSSSSSNAPVGAALREQHALMSNVFGEASAPALCSLVHMAAAAATLDEAADLMRAAEQLARSFSSLRVPVEVAVGINLQLARVEDTLGRRAEAVERLERTLQVATRALCRTPSWLPDWRAATSHRRHSNAHTCGLAEFVETRHQPRSVAFDAEIGHPFSLVVCHALIDALLADDRYEDAFNYASEFYEAFSCFPLPDASAEIVANACRAVFGVEAPAVTTVAMHRLGRTDPKNMPMMWRRLSSGHLAPPPPNASAAAASRSTCDYAARLAIDRTVAQAWQRQALLFDNLPLLFLRLQMANSPLVSPLFDRSSTMATTTTSTEGAQSDDHELRQLEREYRAMLKLDASSARKILSDVKRKVRALDAPWRVEFGESLLRVDAQQFAVRGQVVRVAWSAREPSDQVTAAIFEQPDALAARSSLMSQRVDPFASTTTSRSGGASSVFAGVAPVAHWQLPDFCSVRGHFDVDTSSWQPTTSSDAGTVYVAVLFLQPLDVVRRDRGSAPLAISSSPLVLAESADALDSAQMLYRWHVPSSYCPVAWRLLPLPCSGRRVAKVVLGGAVTEDGSVAALHAFAITRDAGDLFAVGDNRCGQLGIGTRHAAPTLRLVAGCTHVLDVATATARGRSGTFHTLCVLRDGSVLSFGSSSGGQLGHGTLDDRETPRLISALEGERCRAVACGPSLSFAVTRRGALFCWGQSACGALGLGAAAATRREVFPVRNTLLGKQRVASIACGDGHVLLATRTGAVLYFGRTELGAIDVPTLVLPLRSHFIVQVAAGCHHSLALADDGKLFAFGANRHGELGASHYESKLGIVPAARCGGVPSNALSAHRVRLPGMSPSAVTRVSAGGYANVALDAGGGVWQWGNGCAIPHRVRSLSYGRHRIVSLACGGGAAMAVSGTSDDVAAVAAPPTPKSSKHKQAHTAAIRRRFAARIDADEAAFSALCCRLPELLRPSSPCRVVQSGGDDKPPSARVLIEFPAFQASECDYVGLFNLWALPPTMLGATLPAYFDLAAAERTIPIGQVQRDSGDIVLRCRWRWPPSAHTCSARDYIAACVPFCRSNAYICFERIGSDAQEGTLDFVLSKASLRGNNATTIELRYCAARTFLASTLCTLVVDEQYAAAASSSSSAAAASSSLPLVQRRASIASASPSLQLLQESMVDECAALELPLPKTLRGAYCVRYVPNLFSADQVESGEQLALLALDAETVTAYERMHALATAPARDPAALYGNDQDDDNDNDDDDDDDDDDDEDEDEGDCAWLRDDASIDGAALAEHVTLKAASPCVAGEPLRIDVTYPSDMCSDANFVSLNTLGDCTDRILVSAPCASASSETSIDTIEGLAGEFSLYLNVFDFVADDHVCVGCQSIHLVEENEDEERELAVEDEEQELAEREEDDLDNVAPHLRYLLDERMLDAMGATDAQRRTQMLESARWDVDDWHSMLMRHAGYEDVDARRVADALGTRHIASMHWAALDDNALDRVDRLRVLDLRTRYLAAAMRRQLD
jgi:alpha-tubulin suppressor-like RCC1 family protein